VQDKKDVTRQAAVSGSNIQVKIGSVPTEKGKDVTNYLIDFKGDYQVTNPVGITDRLVFQVTPPTGYSLLQNFDVEQGDRKLVPTNPGEYNFPIQVAPGKVSKLRVSYRAQGSPQWVYSPKDGSLVNFEMRISSLVPGLNFLSGISPTKVDSSGEQKLFIWKFDRQTSAPKPFGVAATPALSSNPTSTVPLLLLVAPGILLWWLLLLYFSIPMQLVDVAIAGFVFFASIFALTYFSRIANPQYIWGGISLGLLVLVWGLGRRNWRMSMAAVICTIAGVIVPVTGFILNYRGLMLSAAGLISILWLTTSNWYGLYDLEHQPDRSSSFYNSENPSSVFTRHDILEESGNYGKSPAPSAEEAARRLREKD
jgi:hypothetical protein